MNKELGNKAGKADRGVMEALSCPTQTAAAPAPVTVTNLETGKPPAAISLLSGSYFSGTL